MAQMLTQPAKRTVVIQYHGKYWRGLEGKFVLYDWNMQEHDGVTAGDIGHAAHFNSVDEAKHYVDSMFKQDIGKFTFHTVATVVVISPV